ncbi:MAG: histidinol-phosphate aminotransferase family protein [Dehalococcoidia bacterium]|nr:histidinol-phosphate aminotransferase family protein [Dehalococcoidia bacterium]
MSVVHGGLREDERARLQAAGVTPIDLSASLNPYGPHAAVVEAARTAAVDRYPDPRATPLREAYATRHACSPAEVLAGNGSSELIFLAIAALAGEAPGAGVVIAGPTFGEYAPAAAAIGARVTEVRAKPPAFAIPVAALLAAIEAARPAVTIVCNPNNPTGQCLSPAQVERLTAAARAAGGWLVVDEAYVDFAEDGTSVGPAPGRVVLRTATKLHAIPGLRVGVAFGPAEAIAAMERRQPPWPVSAPAIAASLRALEERAFAAESIAAVRAARAVLEDGLRSLGLEAPPSHANFVLVPVGDGTAFRARLLPSGFVVRDCASFGLGGHVRIAIPRAEQVAPLLAAIAGALEGA